VRGVSEAGPACPVLCSRLHWQGAAHRNRTGGALWGAARQDFRTRSCAGPLQP
jgi:hypothetical protein